MELNYERSIWVDQEDIGKYITIEHGNKRYEVRVPERINKQVTVRMRGLGKTSGSETGDLLLHILLNKGDDISKNLWISEASARNGANKTMRIGDSKISVVIPENSHDGSVVRLKGLGRKLELRWSNLFLHRNRGDMLVKLSVFPDSITPVYRSFDQLSTDDMVLEGWVYRKFDEVIDKMGKSAFAVKPVQADTVADLFNESGWRSIFDLLVQHLKLDNCNITLSQSDTNDIPGSCQITVIYHDNAQDTRNYAVTVSEKYLESPFSLAAIFAHELCHVVYYENIGNNLNLITYSQKSEKPVVRNPKAEKDLLEMERTVDLLVFMFKIGEFQLRVARDRGLTLGYFNQDMFERIHVIISRKGNSL